MPAAIRSLENGALETLLCEQLGEGLREMLATSSTLSLPDEWTVNYFGVVIFGAPSTPESFLDLLAGLKLSFMDLPFFFSHGEERDPDRERERERTLQGPTDGGSKNGNATGILGFTSLGTRAGSALCGEGFDPGTFPVGFTTATPGLASRGHGTHTPGLWPRILQICGAFRNS